MPSFLKPLGRFVEARRKRFSSLSVTARRSFYISAAIHLAILFSAGAIVIGHIFYNRESTFVGQPPPMKSYEPQKLEFKVKVSKQQRSSSRPSMVPRMVSTKLSSTISLPEIKMDAKVIKTSFQPKFKAFSGTGLGAGLGTGYGLGGFGAGVSQINFFGIQGKGERVAILVDVSVSMVEDEKGGPKGFDRVKERLGKVIESLAEGSMFNVIVFAEAASTWEKEMVVATDDHKTKAKQFIRPFNTTGNYGLTSGNIQPSKIGMPSAGGETRLDLALTAAFDQGADVILIISDGLPRVRKVFTDEMRQGYEAQRAEWQNTHAAAVQQWDAGQAAAAVTEQRVWIPPTPAQPARPPRTTGLKEGQPPDPGSPAIAAQPGRWEVRRVTSGGGGAPRPAPPPMPDAGWWTLSDFVQHLKILHEALYVKKGKKLPVIHCIGYGIDKDGGDFLKGLAETYKGRYRRVARID